MTFCGGDLAVLVPDKNMEAIIHGLLSRPDALQILPVRHDVFTHYERDPGCFHRGHDFLRPMTSRYQHGLLVFDRVGSGQEHRSREELENIVGRRLSTSGWNDRASVVVLDPELEVWVWSDSPEVAKSLGWEGREPNLRSWLMDCSLWPSNASKPPDPKTAVERTLRHVKTPRTSAIYRRLARTVSFERCTDPAFLKLKNLLKAWFPKPQD